MSEQIAINNSFTSLYFTSPAYFADKNCRSRKRRPACICPPSRPLRERLSSAYTNNNNNNNNSNNDGMLLRVIIFEHVIVKKGRPAVTASIIVIVTVYVAVPVPPSFFSSSSISCLSSLRTLPLGCPTFAPLTGPPPVFFDFISVKKERILQRARRKTRVKQAIAREDILAVPSSSSSSSLFYRMCFLSRLLGAQKYTLCA